MLRAIPRPPAAIVLLLLAPPLLALCVLAPQTMLELPMLIVLVAIVVVGWEAPSFCIAVLVGALALSPEFHLKFMNQNGIIALHKIGLLGAGIASWLRFGGSGQFNGPMLAYILMFVIGLATGNLHPEMDALNSFRSLIGVAAQFIFISCRLQRSWHDRFILLVAGTPLISLFFGIPAYLVGFDRQLFMFDNGTYRLESLNHPAFLAYFGSIAIYACVLELVRTWHWKWIALGCANFVITVATGTRGPIIVSLIMAGLSVLFAYSPRFTGSRRMVLVALGLGLLVLLAGTLGPYILQRSFSSYSQQGGFQFSGRDIIWSLFVREFWKAPLFGRGVGAGRFAVPIEEVEILGSNAAHNEYLRIAVDGGAVGVIYLFILTAIWIARELRFMPRGQRPVILAWAVAFMVHCFTGNTLIAPPAVTLFFWLAVVFQRARDEAAFGVRSDQGARRRDRLRIA
jgi:hypothetical protein